MRVIRLLILALCALGQFGFAQNAEMKTRAKVTESTVGDTTTYKVDSSVLEGSEKVYPLSPKYIIETDGAIKESKDSSGKKILLEVLPPPVESNSKAGVSPRQTVYCRLTGSKNHTYCTGGQCPYPQKCTHVKDANNDYCACK